MSKINNEVIDISPVVVEENSGPHIEKDYEFTRDNLRELVEKGNDALDGILELAKESEHPRAYEVVGQLIKTIADANRDIIDLQKSMKQLTKKDPGGPKNVTNALFVGSTHELQKILKNSSGIIKEEK